MEPGSWVDHGLWWYSGYGQYDKLLELSELDGKKVILDLGDSLRGRILAFDALEMTFREYKLRIDPENQVTYANRDRIEIVEFDDICSPTIN